MSEIVLVGGGIPSAPAAGKLRLFFKNDAVPKYVGVINSSSEVLVLFGIDPADYRLSNIVPIDATGTYTPPAGVRALLVECWGAGGGGGGCGTAASNASAAGGGGGGAHAAAFITTDVQGDHDVTIGTAGTGASAGNNTGGTGGDTEFENTTGTVIVRAKGGLGGGGDAVNVIHVGGVGGLGGDDASCIGDILQQGAPGGTGLVLTAGQTLSGFGANGFEGGGGGAQRKNGTGAGNAATGYGAGGSGATIVTGGASQAGGAGFQGFIRIWEFK